MLRLASCVSEQVAVRPSRSDSLELVVSAEGLADQCRVRGFINAISENLALIKSRENTVTVAGVGGGRRPVEEIDNDIKAIDRLRGRTAQKISRCNVRRPSCARPICVSTVWKMIADMNRQLAEKKAEVEQLREGLVRMGDEVKEPDRGSGFIHSAEVENLSGEKVRLQNQLNTVYYIVEGREGVARRADHQQAGIHRTDADRRDGTTISTASMPIRACCRVPVGQKKATSSLRIPRGRTDW